MTDFEKIGERMRIDRLERRIQSLEELVKRLNLRLEALEELPQHQ